MACSGAATALKSWELSTLTPQGEQLIHVSSLSRGLPTGFSSGCARDTWPDAAFFMGYVFLFQSLPIVLQVCPVSDSLP